MGNSVSFNRRRTHRSKEQGLPTLLTEIIATLPDTQPTACNTKLKSFEFQDIRKREANKAIRFAQTLIPLCAHQKENGSVLTRLCVPVSSGELSLSGDDFKDKAIETLIVKAIDRMSMASNKIDKDDLQIHDQKGENNLSSSPTRKDTRIKRFQISNLREGYCNEANNWNVTKIDEEKQIQPYLVERQEKREHNSLSEEHFILDNQIKIRNIERDINSNNDDLVNTCPPFCQPTPSLQQSDEKGKSSKSSKKPSVSFKFDGEDQTTFCSDDLNWLAPIKTPKSKALKPILKGKLNILKPFEASLHEPSPGFGKESSGEISRIHSLKGSFLKTGSEKIDSKVFNENRKASLQETIQQRCFNKLPVRKFSQQVPESSQSLKSSFLNENLSLDSRNASILPIIQKKVVSDKENVEPNTDHLKLNPNKLKDHRSAKIQSKTRILNQIIPKSTLTRNVYIEKNDILQQPIKRLNQSENNQRKSYLKPSAAASQPKSTQQKQIVYRRNIAQRNLENIQKKHVSEMHLNRTTSKKQVYNEDLEIETINVDLDLQDLIEAAEKVSNTQYLKHSVSPIERTLNPKSQISSSSFVTCQQIEETTFCEDPTPFSKTNDSRFISHQNVLEERERSLKDIKLDGFRDHLDKRDSDEGLQYLSLNKKASNSSYYK